ncbi:hypothetical protein BH10ACT6_BH10ACT6_01550 [soil metagenome]
MADKNGSSEIRKGAGADGQFGSRANIRVGEGSRGSGANGGASGGNAGKVVPPAPKVPAPVKPQQD